jgi:hypothetical protein
MPKGRPRHLFDREIQASWLTVYFEGLVIDRDNRLRQAQGRQPKTTVGPSRQRKFLNAARCLLSRRDAPDLAEIVEVLEWLFGTWQGYLPFLENTDYPATDGKITRFWTIRNHYHELVAAMKEPQTAPTRSTTTPPKPKAYYDHGEDFAMEDQVSTLVELFAKTKRRPASDFDLFGWRKTFRIMLEHRQIPYEDIAMVVTALGDKRLHLDFGRYSAPYDLVGRPGEWENILASVKIALLREQKFPTPAPSRRRHWDDDNDYYRSPRPNSDAGGSVDMAASVEARRRRYEARQRPPQRASNA